MIQERVKATRERSYRGTNTVKYTIFHWCDKRCSFVFLFLLEFGEAGISQAGLALVVRPARSCWIFGTAFHGPSRLTWGMAAELASGYDHGGSFRECVCPWLK